MPSGKRHPVSLAGQNSLDDAIRLHQRGHLDEAGAIYRQILSSHPDHGEALHLLGLVEHQQGRHREAVKLIERALEGLPQNAACHSNLALALRACGRRAEAVEHLRQAVALDADYLAARKNLAIVLQELGELDEAAEQYQALAKRSPGEAGPLSGLAIVWMKQGRYPQAEQALRQALDLQPEDADLHNNLGVVLKELRRHQEAEAHLRRAIAAKPQSCAFRCNLGLVLSEQGRLDEACKIAQEAVEIDPRSASAKNQLAVAFKQLGRLDEAEAQLQAAVRIAPDDVASLTNLGDIITLRGRPQEALGHLEQALRLDPTCAEAHNNLAVALKDLDRGVEMLPHLERAVQLNPRNTPALNNLASDRITRGQVPEGTDLLLRVLAIDPNDVPAHYTLAISTRHEFSAEDVGRMTDLLARRQLAPDSLELLHFALATVLDKKAAHSEAFEHAIQANRLKTASYRRRGLDFDRAEHLALVDGILTTFSADAFSTLARSGLANEEPIFVVGMPRSGTTLVEQILASHPRVFGAGELNDVAKLAADLPRRLKNPTAFPACVARLDADLASDLAVAHLGRLRRLGGTAARIVDKMTINFLYLGLIALLFPRARIVHCRRDPRDTALSCFFHNFGAPGLHFTFDLEDLGFYYRQYERLMAHWRDVLPLRLFEVQYEELVQDQEKHSRALIDFCGLEWDSRCLNFHQTQRPVKTASSLQVRQPIYTRSVGRWKPYEAQLQPLVRALAGQHDSQAVARSEVASDLLTPPKTAPAGNLSVAIYGLLYGDHANLHKRLINSLLQHAKDPAVTVTLWCNQVCEESLRLLRATPFRLHISNENVPKYRAMRRLFAEGIAGDWVVWFDDDAWVTAPDWLPHMRRYIHERAGENVCYIGPMRFGKHLGGVADFVRQAAWYRGRAAASYEGHNGAPFVLGGYWWLRADVLRLLDWPDPRLNHNGGDTLLGDAIWQHHLPLHDHSYGVKIEMGPRRGFSEPNAGVQPAAPEPSVEELLDAAIKQHQAGDLAAAQERYDRILHHQPGHPDALHLTGVVAHQRGRHDEALGWIERAVVANPKDAKYHSNRGLVLRALGRREEGAAALERAVELDPAYVGAWHNLGVVLRELGRLEQAESSLRETLRLQPGDGVAWRHLGDLLLAQARQEDATEAFRQALTLRPADPDTHNNLGVALKDLGRFKEGEEHYRESLRLRPNHAPTHNNLGILLTHQDRQPEAVPCFTEALRLSPEFADARHNLGAVLADLGRHEEAIENFRAALALKADEAEYHNSLGASLHILGQPGEALACYNRALKLNPTHTWAHFNRSQVCLLLGDFEQGWPEWEWRWRRPGAPVRTFDRPAWDGSAMPGGTLLLYAEQGLGDTLQFVRLARMVRPLVGRVVVECQEALVPLLRICDCIDMLVARGQPLPPFDAHAPLMSVPGLLRLDRATIPGEAPYLSADTALREKWHGRLSGLTGLRVGIAWQGNPRYKRDAFRSVTLAQFAPLAAVPGARLISLQKGPGREQLTDPRTRPDFAVVDLGEEVDEAAGAFMDTAAIMKHLDLVITSDTAIPHLAGALGVPVWMAVPFAPDWRWQLEGEACPWYPTMRLFRQPALGDWNSVFARMRDELLALSAQLRTSQSTTVAIEISPGELLDRLTIAEIKSERIGDVEKLKNVHTELSLLQAARARSIPDSPELTNLTAELKSVNERLWDIEDELRECERRQEFGPRFIELARLVYRTNDGRSDIKRQINLLRGSALQEEKSYQPY